MLSFDSENPEILTHCEGNVYYLKIILFLPNSISMYPNINFVPIVPLTDVTTHYVDPSNYDSVENVLRKFTTKLNEKNLKTEAIIGEGNARQVEVPVSYK